jgi:hypothetical protein
MRDSLNQHGYGIFDMEEKMAGIFERMSPSQALPIFQALLQSQETYSSQTKTGAPGMIDLETVYLLLEWDLTHPVRDPEIDPVKRHPE